MGKMFSFQGVANRVEYLLSQISALLLFSVAWVFAQSDANAVPAFLALIITVIGCWLSLATEVRRWHDRNQSGWWALIRVIPFVNILALFYLLFAGSVTLNNRYVRRFYNGDDARKTDSNAAI